MIEHSAAAAFSINVDKPEKAAVLLSGPWCVGSTAVSASSLLQRLYAARAQRKFSEIIIDCSGVSSWDSALVATIHSTIGQLKVNNIDCSCRNLPEGVKKLLELGFAVPPPVKPADEPRGSLLVIVGKAACTLFDSGRDTFAFLGELTIAMARFILGKANFQRLDLITALSSSGPEALPIVALISTLVGLILAFIGAIQLSQFGAQIYVANLVGIAMAREMGAIMAAIILAGRTGAAFAAQLGTMQVNEEIDALKTFGIKPMEFLVLPRTLALACMMPLLCIFADILGTLGGGLIGVFALGLSPILYWNQTVASVSMNDFLVGTSKSVVFGILVACAGCMRGMQCGRSAASVGEATTSAVVTAIVLIVITDAVFAIALNIMGV